MRPAVLCKLKKGKVLDANPGFVDTFNWLVDFCNNLKGDGDVDRNKAITVDKTIDDRPVIKVKGLTGGGGGGSIIERTIPAAYDIAPWSAQNDALHFVNRYFEVSGVVREGPDCTDDLRSHANAFVAIKITNSATAIAYYQSLSAMQADMVDQTKVVMPLYKLDANGDVAVDFRHLPRADMWSLGLAGSAAS